MFKQKLQNLII